MGRLSGKVAIITGGASGIGRRTVERFVEEGARVLIADVAVDAGEELARSLGRVATFLRTDVTQEEDCERMVERALQRYGQLDCLFNNAGSASPVFTPEEVTQQTYRNDFDLLVGGVLFGMKYAVPILRRQGSGCVINTASVAGTRTGYGPLLYSAAKAAVIQLSRVAAMDLAQHNVRVNSLSPAGLATPIFSRVFGVDPGEEAMRGLRSALSEIMPLGRAGSPDDGANAVVYLASDEGAYVTGHDMVVDAGATAGMTGPQAAATFGKIAEAMGLAVGSA